MDRVVLRLMCDDRGEITFLFGPWGAVDRARAIRHIESGKRRYTLQRRDGSRAPLRVIGDGPSRSLFVFAHAGEVLRTDEALHAST
jgi:hypothetical protein